MKEKKKFLQWLSYRKIAAAFTILFIVSCIPVIYMGLFNYATGDDLLYGAPLRNAIHKGYSFQETCKTILTDIYYEYLGFTGNWSIMFTWRIEPSIWGERFYSVTTLIAMFCLTVAPYYLLRYIFVHLWKIRRAAFIIIFTALDILMIQYQPKPRAGLYWYTGMALYTLSFGIAMFAVAWGMKYIETQKKRYFIGTTILTVYLSGAGYPELTFMAACLFFMIVYCMIDRKRRHKGLMLCIPMILLMIGFYVCASSPGNQVRGGTDFGFSIGKAMGVLLNCVIRGITGIAEYFVMARPLIAVLVLMMIIFWEVLPQPAVAEKDILRSFRHPIIVSAVLFLTYCSAYAPELYAGDNVVAGISGGVYDSYYFIFMLLLPIEVFYLIGWSKVRFSAKWNEISWLKKENFADSVRRPFVIVMFVLCILGSKHLVGNTIDYTCVEFVKNGGFADYLAQMEERIAVLEDPDIRNVILPEMNDEQGPFMHFSLMNNPDSYTNDVTRKFYDKDTVIAVPREEYDSSMNSK